MPQDISPKSSFSPFSSTKQDLLTGPPTLTLQPGGVHGTPGGADLFAGSLTHIGPVFIHYQEFSTNTHINSLQTFSMK